MNLLYKYLRENNIRQRHLAEASGLHETTICRICKGSVTPNAEQKAAICSALQIGEEVVFNPFENLSNEDQEIQLLVSWLGTDEGKLVFRRVRQVMGVASDPRSAVGIEDVRGEAVP